MTGKLQTCFSRDSEHLNHSTWIWHLSFSFFFYAHWKKHHMHLAVIMVLIICVDRYQLPDNDDILAKWPGRETNIHWIEKWAWGNGTLLKVRLVMDVASYQFPLNQRYLIQMCSFLLYHQGSTTSVVKKNLYRDCFWCNISLIRVSVYFSNSPLSLFDKGKGWW